MKHAASLRTGLCALLLVVATTASADSTTGTSFSVTGKPVPGRQVNVHVVVTGKHLVFVPPTAVRGGNVQITLNGEIVLSVEADAHNSTGIGSPQCIPDPSFTYCITYKYTATQTDVTFPVTLPKGVTTYTIGARYTGDSDSHSSDAAPQTLAPVHPGAMAGIIDTVLE
ncbi:hypothetical protein [Luteibacter sp. Lutesp34]|uniref:hypothetical protein n=1 Tax=Luteibacter sp. Lutesp34 TaxID=3243030 RepID=UPI0039B6C364